MHSKLIPTGYLVGLSLLISSIIYFFASNWQLFERTEKVLLAGILMLVFFILSFVLSNFQTAYSFLEEWIWLAGAIAFGVSVAVIGQTYNSHADSYMLYLVWFIPVIAFSFLTRYQPLFVLSFLLSVAIYFFYIFPTSYDPGWTDGQEFFFLLLFLLFCHMWFFFSRSSYLTSRWIEYGSFGIMHVIFLTQSFGSGFHTGVTAWMYIGYMLVSLYLWKKTENRVWFIVSGLGLSLFLFFKGVSVVYDVIGIGVYFIFLALIIVIIVFTLIYLNRLELSSKVSDPWKQRMKSSLSVIVTVFCTLMLISSFTGLLALWTSSFLTVFLASIGLLILPSMLVKKGVPLLSHVLLLAGITIMFGSSMIYYFTYVFSSDGTQVPYYTIVTIGAIMLFIKVFNHRWIDLYLYLLLNASLLLSLFVFSENRGLFDRIEIDHYFLTMALINIGLFFLIKRNWLRSNAIVYTISLLFALTFMNKGEWEYWFYNCLFLVIVFTMIFYRTKRHLLSYWVGITFLFAFLVYKYYDFAWALFHKSITLLIASFIMFGVTWYLSKKDKREVKVSPSFVKTKWKPLLLIVIVMTAFIFYQGFQNEMIVRNGTEMKLKLAPIDPRSMLQGDYVHLNYEISTLNNVKIDRQKKITVVLEKNDEGYHEYSGIYGVEGNWNDAYTPSSSDVIINGVLNGNGSVHYGIESFFIQEGTGAKYEEMEYAIVKVGSNGNAILTELGK
ncbi:GDYXXLXY domain-containing protein [Alkalihalobacillus sp. CinArs1]|uniref:GDYXXLXY domain-containing protein n=1 Tax=Alkalihalobacillus sp. CinArs1 TaxID=2995314 RepID=UPI0022DD30BF|nr:GDYXXLXY domain-containing protein [Alkalihalobacillus sp. CinArs1]